jgi:hypothetical protein
VCTVTIWSSTALFFVPLCVGLASLVFLPSIRNDLQILLGIFLSLTPIFLMAAYNLQVLHEAPVHMGFVFSTGKLSVNGEEFGGLHLKSTCLVMLLILPLMARRIGDHQFQTNVLRICMVGIFTVMAPFLVEAVADITGLNFLSQRLPAAYPLLLLIGMGASVAVTLLNQYESTTKVRASKYRVLLLALICYGMLFGLMRKEYFNTPKFKFFAAIQEAEFNEAAAARMLIQNDSFVSAGYLDEFLPILPEPPSFTGVRHYLGYHRFFLSDSEFSDWEYLYNVLKDLSPQNGDDLETTLNLMVSTAENLGVTTMVFQALGFEPNPEKVKFVTALTARLKRVGYDCATTTSGRARVCNRKVAAQPGMVLH